MCLDTVYDFTNDITTELLDGAWFVANNVDPPTITASYDETEGELTITAANVIGDVSGAVFSQESVYETDAPQLQFIEGWRFQLGDDETFDVPGDLDSCGSGVGTSFSCDVECYQMVMSLAQLSAAGWQPAGETATHQIYRVNIGIELYSNETEFHVDDVFANITVPKDISDTVITDSSITKENEVAQITSASVDPQTAIFTSRVCFHSAFVKAVPVTGSSFGANSDIVFGVRLEIPAECTFGVLCTSCADASFPLTIDGESVIRAGETVEFSLQFEHITSDPDEQAVIEQGFADPTLAVWEIDFPEIDTTTDNIGEFTVQPVISWNLTSNPLPVRHLSFIDFTVCIETEVLIADADAAIQWLSSCGHLAGQEEESCFDPGAIDVKEQVVDGAIQGDHEYSEAPSAESTDSRECFDVGWRVKVVGNELKASVTFRLTFSESRRRRRYLLQKDQTNTIYATSTSDVIQIEDEQKENENGAGKMNVICALIAVFYAAIFA